MKEATGELNMTVIAVVAISAIAALFYAFVWPSLKTTIASQSVCANGPGTIVGSAGNAGYVNCSNVNTSNGTYTCQYVAEENGNLSTKSATCKTR